MGEQPSPQVIQPISSFISALQKHSAAKAGLFQIPNRRAGSPAPPKIQKSCVSLYCLVARSMAGEQDIIKLPLPKTPPKHTSRRIGIHASAAGGVHTAAERAY